MLRRLRTVDRKSRADVKRACPIAQDGQATMSEWVALRSRSPLQPSPESRAPSPESRVPTAIIDFCPMDFLSALNSEQREAVLQIDGPLLILAGAGSGKTRVITYRIAYLIGDGHAEPGEVLAVTFTNKAAGEMRERVEGLIGDDGQGRLAVDVSCALCAVVASGGAEDLAVARFRDLRLVGSGRGRQAGAQGSEHRRQARAAADGAVADQSGEEPDGGAGLARGATTTFATSRSRRSTSDTWSR